jgi:hypothetical protein
MTIWGILTNSGIEEEDYLSRIISDECRNIDFLSHADAADFIDRIRMKVDYEFDKILRAVRTKG